MRIPPVSVVLPTQSRAPATPRPGSVNREVGNPGLEYAGVFNRHAELIRRDEEVLSAAIVRCGSTDAQPGVRCVPQPIGSGGGVDVPERPPTQTPPSRLARGQRCRVVPPAPCSGPSGWPLWPLWPLWSFSSLWSLWSACSSRSVWPGGSVRPYCSGRQSSSEVACEQRGVPYVLASNRVVLDFAATDGTRGYRVGRAAERDEQTDRRDDVRVGEMRAQLREQSISTCLVTGGPRNCIA